MKFDFNKIFLNNFSFFHKKCSNCIILGKLFQDIVNNNLISPIGLQTKIPLSPTHRPQKQPFGNSCTVNNNNTSTATSIDSAINDKQTHKYNSKLFTNYTVKGKLNMYY